MNNKKLIDIAERVAATAAEAGLAIAITEIADIKAVWVIPVTAVLAWGKSWLATKFGNKESASLAKSV